MIRLKARASCYHILWGPRLSVKIIIAMHQKISIWQDISVKSKKYQPCGVASGKVRESTKWLELILKGP